MSGELLRFLALFIVFIGAYGAMITAGVALGVIGLAEGIVRVTSVAGAFALGWVFRGDP